MRNLSGRVILVCLFALLPWETVAIAQYGGGGNKPRGDGSGNTRSNTNDDRNTGNANNTDRRRRGTVGTSADDETSDERDARRDKGLEEPEKKGAPPGIAQGPELVGKIEEGNWGTLTPEQQAAAVAELKKFGEAARAKVNGNLALNETKHFLVYSDLKPADATKWTGQLERMYGNLSKLFGIKDGENIFRGKAAVFLFAKEQDYHAFQKAMHDTDSTDTAGLCHCFGNGDVHIGFFRQPNDADFNAVLVHESVHGFLHRYRKPPNVPTWVNEGLAETIAAELAPQRGKRQELRQYAIGQLRERGTLGSDFFTGNRLEGWQYPVAQLLTEFMIRQDKKRYVAFIDGIKDGLKWEEALTQKYGVPRERLVTAFAESLNIKALGAAAPRPDRRRPGQGQEDPEERERAKER